jgi:hypothetical protein
MFIDIFTNNIKEISTKKKNKKPLTFLTLTTTTLEAIISSLLKSSTISIPCPVAPVALSLTPGNNQSSKEKIMINILRNDIALQLQKR